MASTLLESISQDDYEKARTMSRRKFQSNLQSYMITSFKNGEIEGANQRTLEIVKKMIKRNTPIEFIIEDTGLSIEEIQKLK
jgi:predicted transposase/invertase (TIGR01784 family)